MFTRNYTKLTNNTQLRAISQIHIAVCMDGWCRPMTPTRTNRVKGQRSWLLSDVNKHETLQFLTVKVHCSTQLSSYRSVLRSILLAHRQCEIVAREPVTFDSTRRAAIRLYKASSIEHICIKASSHCETNSLHLCYARF